LTLAEVFVFIVSRTNSKGVLAAEKFGKATGAGHKVPIDLRFIAREEIRFHLT
jgi:hypothetical protein